MALLYVCASIEGNFTLRVKIGIARETARRGYHFLYVRVCCEFQRIMFNAGSVLFKISFSVSNFLCDRRNRFQYTGKVYRYSRNKFVIMAA